MEKTEGLGAYNINPKDAQTLYILLKTNVDIEELKALLNSFDTDLNKIID
ncbi:hypothetical protein [Vagococcus lutrae]|nr:hypothetical protein [Vagococcus lutrae]MDT2808762.1 hypothetical protein [Vagococcus lutrae]